MNSSDPSLVDSLTLLKSAQRDITQSYTHLRLFADYFQELSITLRELQRREEELVSPNVATPEDIIEALTLCGPMTYEGIRKQSGCTVKSVILLLGKMYSDGRLSRQQYKDISPAPKDGGLFVYSLREETNKVIMKIHEVNHRDHNRAIDLCKMELLVILNEELRRNHTGEGKASFIPDLATISVEVPGGGDYSNTAIDVDHLVIKWVDNGS